MNIKQNLGVFLSFCLVIKLNEVVLTDGESSVLLQERNIESNCDYFCTEVNDTSTYVPPSFTNNCPPQDFSQSYTVPPGKNFVVLKWTDPFAEDQHGKAVRVEQVAGVKNGGIFTGSVYGQQHQIVYIATDSNGLKDNCYFVTYVSIPECPRLNVVENGQYRCTDDRSPDSSCMFTCNEGYVLNEMGNITCEYKSSDLQISPAWSGSRRCERINCSEPTSPENANMTCSNVDYGYDSVCLVQCNQGYTPSGPLYMICKADGFWSEPTYCLKNDAFELQCSSAQCNGHTCILLPNQQIQCNCSNGWSGQTCEQPPDYCRNNICMNNGNCNNQYLAYNCTCPNTYSGVLCQISPVDGNWSDWTSWSSCSQTCGSGNQTRLRFCNSPYPGPGGKDCQGDGFDNKPCYLSKCKDCPPLKQYNSSRSVYHCEIYDNYEQERCLVICENGTLLLPQFKQFDEILCGWPTNNDWIPANIQPTCVAPDPPKGLQLESRISYNKLIPKELENAFKQEVLVHLQPTECVTTTKCDILVQFSNTTSQSGSVISNLAINFQILLESGKRKRSLVIITADGGSSIQEARHILEETAEYIKNYTGELFDIRLEETEFISDKKSIVISTSTLCEEGSVPQNGMCVICPVGSFATSGRCVFCEKGYYQDKDGQTRCEPCPAGKSTAQPGAIRPYECSESTVEVNTLEKVSDIVTIVVAIVTPIVSLVVGIPAFIKVYLKCSKKKGKKYETAKKMKSFEENKRSEKDGSVDASNHTECDC